MTKINPISERENGNGVSRRDFLKTSASFTVGATASGVLLGTFSPHKALAGSAGGILTVARSGAVDTYDPHGAVADDSQMVNMHVCESLVTRDWKPMLATSWENPDELTWIFHLRKDVQFANGQPFDASVVKFNLERYKDPKTKARYRGLLKPVTSIEPLDNHTLQVKTKTPYAVFLLVLGDILMMSPQSGREQGKDTVREPIGTGPFVFKEWIPMEKTVIAINANHYGVKPKAKEIVWKYVPEPSTRIVELKAGAAHIVNKVPPELAGGLKGKKSKIVRKQGLYRFGIKFNCAQAPFNNIKVRQAFNYAMNKEEIIEYVLRGAGHIATCPLGPDRQGHNPDLKPYPHDPARAKKLLAEAGYADGLNIEILTPHGRYLKDKEVTEAIAYQVKEVGINMKVKPLEWGMFLKQFKTSQGFFVASGHRDAQKLFFVTGDSRSKAYSWMGYHNDEWMKLYDEAGKTFDLDKRNAMYRKIAKIEWEDAPWGWLYYSQDIYGVSNRVKNFEPRGDGFLLLSNVSV